MKEPSGMVKLRVEWVSGRERALRKIRKDVSVQRGITVAELVDRLLREPGLAEQLRPALEAAEGDPAGRLFIALNNRPIHTLEGLKTRISEDGLVSISMPIHVPVARR